MTLIDNVIHTPEILGKLLPEPFQTLLYNTIGWDKIPYTSWDIIKHKDGELIWYTKSETMFYHRLPDKYNSRDILRIGFREWDNIFKIKEILNNPMNGLDTNDIRIIGLNELRNLKPEILLVKDNYYFSNKRIETLSKPGTYPELENVNFL